MADFDTSEMASLPNFWVWGFIYLGDDALIS